MLTVEAFTFNPFAENTYLIYNHEKECIIIDPGCYNQAEKNILQEHIKDNHLKPTVIFLTHTHIDHIFGLAAMKSTYGVPILAHPMAETGINTTGLVAQMYGLNVEEPPPIDQFINEGDDFKLGAQSLQIFFCPGHAPDHLVLYSEKDGFAIVGDVIFKESIGRTDLPGGDYQTLMDSIHQKILILPSNTVLYSGHGPETTIKQEITNNPFLK